MEWDEHILFFLQLSFFFSFFSSSSLLGVLCLFSQNPKNLFIQLFTALIMMMMNQLCLYFLLHLKCILLFYTLLCCCFTSLLIAVAGQSLASDLQLCWQLLLDSLFLHSSWGFIYLSLMEDEQCKILTAMISMIIISFSILFLSTIFLMLGIKKLPDLYIYHHHHTQCHSWI